MGRRGPKSGHGGRPTKKKQSTKSQRSLDFYLPNTKKADEASDEQNGCAKPRKTNDDESDEANNKHRENEKEGETASNVSNEGKDGMAVEFDDDAEAEINDIDNEASNEKQLYWHPRTLKWLMTIQEELKAKTNYHRLKCRISPQSDPIRYKKSSLLLKTGRTNDAVLDRHDFCLPDVLVWCPEEFYPEFYKNNLPPCKWHGCSDCVVRHGFTGSPRHCYDEFGVTALIGKVYYCATNKAANVCGKRYFRNYDPQVIARSPDYIRKLWEKEGFKLSHRGGIRWTVIKQMESCVLKGMGANGFLSILKEQYKKKHGDSKVMYRSYVDSLWETLPLFVTRDDVLSLMEQQFFEFESPEYSGQMPSLAFLLEQMVQVMEDQVAYMQRRMQLKDTNSLSGDHSKKTAMSLRADCEKVFEALYMMMNNYGQVPAWQLTHGTGMDELKPLMEGLKKRCEMLGFEHPNFITTDRCCSERKFWNECFDLGGAENFKANVDEEDMVDEGNVIRVRSVGLPCSPEFTASAEIANELAREINDEIQTLPANQHFVSVACQWRIGGKKADVVQVGTHNGSTYVFHLAKMKVFPNGLKLLLENPKIGKVGNLVSSAVSKLQEWGIALGPTIELGHLAKARLVTQTNTPSLVVLVRELFKNQDILMVRPKPLSNTFGEAGLSQDHIQCAAIDAYVALVVYKKLISMPNPRNECAIKVQEVEDDLQVKLYAQSWRCLVGIGVLTGCTAGEFAMVRVSTGGVRVPGALIAQPDGSAPVTFDEAMRTADNSGSFEIPWRLSWIRRHNIAADVCQVTLNYKEETVLEDTVDNNLKCAYQEGAKQNRDTTCDGSNRDGEDGDIDSSEEVAGRCKRRSVHGDGEDGDCSEDEEGSDCSEEDDSDSSDQEDGEPVNPTRPPKLRRPSVAERSQRRSLRMRDERVKLDILHVFLRFESVLFKNHGAYAEFMSDLRDALFIVDEADLAAVKRALIEEKHLKEEQVVEYLEAHRAWVLARVKRLVPDPRMLEKRYREVVNLYRGVLDVKTGKPLFSHKQHSNLHKQMLRHIRKNCLSDIPGMAYYFELTRDSIGLPIYKCIRGTSALEGLHQKLGKIIRGYSNSPRYLYALIHSTLYRHNHRLEILARGLSTKYQDFYNGEETEREIRHMERWQSILMAANRNSVSVVSQNDWVPVDVFADTGERFGIINLPRSGTKADKELAVQARDASDAIIQQEAKERIESTGPKSVRWMCEMHGRERPVSRVRDKVGWAFFNEHYSKFSLSPDQSGINQSLEFSAFASFWNAEVDKRVLRKEVDNLHYTTAGLLQVAWKLSKKKTNQRATLLGVVGQQKEMRVAQQGTRVEVMAAEYPQTPDAETAVNGGFRHKSQAAPAKSITNETGALNDEEVVLDPSVLRANNTAEGAQNLVGAIEELQSPPIPGVTNPLQPKTRRENKSSRCRTCGKQYTKDPWKKLHNKRKENLLNHQTVICWVPVADREEGWPIPMGKSMPRNPRDRRKKRKSSEGST